AMPSRVGRTLLSAALDLDLVSLQPKRQHNALKRKSNSRAGDGSIRPTRDKQGHRVRHDVDLRGQCSQQFAVSFDEGTLIRRSVTASMPPYFLAINQLDAAHPPP